MLGRQLIQLAIRAGGKRCPDEIIQIQRGQGHVSAFVCHPIRQVAYLLVPPMGADQIAVIDVGVIDVLARLHLRLQLFHHITFADQVVGDLDPGDRGKRRCQHLAFVFMGRDGF